MAQHVISVAAPRPTVVVTSDPAVRDWASDLCDVLMAPSGLNSAVQFAFESLRGRFDRVIVVHADLAHLESLDAFDPPATPTEFLTASIGPDSTSMGTNVLSLPGSVDFVFEYGAGSFDRHLRQLLDLGIDPTIIRGRDTEFDLDTSVDLATLSRSSSPRIT